MWVVIKYLIMSLILGSLKPLKIRRYFPLAILPWVLFFSPSKAFQPQWLVLQTQFLWFSRVCCWKEMSTTFSVEVHDCHIILIFQQYIRTLQLNLKNNHFNITSFCHSQETLTYRRSFIFLWEKERLGLSLGSHHINAVLPWGNCLLKANFAFHRFT